MQPKARRDHEQLSFNLNLNQNSNLGIGRDCLRENSVLMADMIAIHLPVLAIISIKHQKHYPQQDSNGCGD